VTPSERRIERIVAVAFAVTMITGVALLAVYASGGQTQVEGVLLAVCLASLGIGIIVWAEYLMNTPVSIEERHPFASSGASPALSEVLDEEAGFTRRRLLVRMLFGALAGLGAALAIPALSLGPAPGRELFTTSWARGKRLVDLDGVAVRAADIEVGSITTVFPEGDAGSARAQTLLIRVPPGALRLGPDRLAGAPDGYVAYSKVCTHAGCPVGLYLASEQHLVCPCHQSTFDVLDGATPITGPAGRALPQLPIAMADDGTFTALGDFPEPVGPAFWNITS
jgi:ubiquinol-cytochrome c reductase iron-sulfur subunit